jgi:hypothetical protein
MSLEHLKAGDTVYINSRWRGILFYKIDRVTKTQIIIGNTKYNKNGYQIGSRDKWNSTCIQEATPEIIQQYKKQKLQKTLIELQEIKITDENYEDILSHINSLLKYKDI